MPDFLSVRPSIILVDVNVGETSGSAEVKFEVTGIPEAFIWERKLGSSWVKRDLQGSETQGDEWTITLPVGGRYQVALYAERDANPNNSEDLSDPEPLFVKSAVAIRKEGPSPLIQGIPEQGPTGTSYTWSPITAIETFRIMHVGEDPPTQNPNEPFVINDPIGSTRGGPSTNLSLEFASQSLLPGNAYWATLLVFDGAGRWESRKVNFRLWKRTVTIKLDEIRIIEDGADGNRDATLRVWVCAGNTFVSSCEFIDIRISDLPDPGKGFMETIGLTGVCDDEIIIAPNQVQEEKRRIYILTRGIGDSGLFETDDIVGNFEVTNSFPDVTPDLNHVNPDAFLHFPVGANQEAVENRQFSSFTEPQNNGGDNTFSYQITARYWVTYDDD